jgi:nucleotide-binding universal stress UspA family protein
LVQGECAKRAPKELTMAALNKILVPVDYSDHSRRAVHFARDLATAFGASLHFVHVFPPAAFVSPPLVPAPVITGDVKVESRRGFEDYLATARSELGVDVSGTLREGVPHLEILEAAKALGADLIVLGTHGKTGIEHLLLGSVAERVVRHATVPVITVPMGA